MGKVRGITLRHQGLWHQGLRHQGLWHQGLWHQGLWHQGLWVMPRMCLDASDLKREALEQLRLVLSHGIHAVLGSVEVRLYRILLLLTHVQNQLIFLLLLPSHPFGLIVYGCWYYMETCKSQQ